MTTTLFPHLTFDGSTREAYKLYQTALGARIQTMLTCAHSAFAALMEGGQITMAVAPAFWAERFGRLTDRFGICRGVNGMPVQIKSLSWLPGR